MSETEPATPPLTPGTPGEVQPPVQPAPLTSREEEWRRQVLIAPAAPTQIEWSKALPGAMLGGVLVALLSGLLPLPLFFVFLWMLAAGWISAAMYKRRVQTPLTPGTGARLGAAAAGIGFLLFAILTVLDFALLGAGKLREVLVQSVQQAAARNPNPRAQELAERFTHLSPQELAALVVLSMILFLLVFLAFSSAGGALFAYFKGRSDASR
ncbi:MAG: hypothetical protein ACE14M_00625 [Terriglobales bacterium]